MTTPTPEQKKPQQEPPARAEHGGRTEVNWAGGKGRQRYANRGSTEAGPAAGGEVEAGDRGDASGRNLDQLEAVKKLP